MGNIMKLHAKGVLIKHYGDRIRYDTSMDYRPSKLDSILTNRVWHPPLATSLQLIEAWSLLQSLERLRPNDKDLVIWMASPNGLFSTSSAWKLISSTGPHVF